VAATLRPQDYSISTSTATTKKLPLLSGHSHEILCCVIREEVTRAQKDPPVLARTDSAIKRYLLPRQNGFFRLALNLAVAANDNF
jgi:hypothetical protein